MHTIFSAGGVLHIELGLKIRVMSFADWLWSVITLTIGLKTIPDLLDTNSTHTGIAYYYITAPHACGHMRYVHHVGQGFGRADGRAERVGARASGSAGWASGLVGGSAGGLAGGSGEMLSN